MNAQKTTPSTLNESQAPSDLDLVALHESKDEYDEPTAFNVFEFVALAFIGGGGLLFVVASALGWIK